MLYCNAIVFLLSYSVPPLFMQVTPLYLKSLLLLYRCSQTIHEYDKLFATQVSIQIILLYMHSGKLGIQHTVVREFFVVKKLSYAQLCTKIKCTKFFIAVYKVCMLLRPVRGRRYEHFLTRKFPELRYCSIIIYFMYWSSLTSKRLACCKLRVYSQSLFQPVNSLFII